jgi:uncharacterized protein (DUF1697 family)
MRYAAFLRGVMPTNCKMPELKKAFEKGGFTDVKTLLGSGNVIFDAPKTSIPSLERKVEAAIEKSLGKSFFTIVRPIDELRAVIESDPFKGVKLKPDSKKIVTFLRKPPRASIFRSSKGQRPHPSSSKATTSSRSTSRRRKGRCSWKHIEKAAGGKGQTTRTWDTVQKAAKG